jgi:uncharacterized glyoxalase superfamily protein PhnB
VDVHPVVRYKDAAAAVDWLKRAFGLEEHVVYRDGDGVVQHAELRAGNGLIMLGRQSEAWMGGTSPDPLGSTVSLYVVVGADVVDAHHERAKAAGARIVMEPTDMDYGSRDYSARDPEGNLWSFGSYDPRAAVPE